MNDAMGHPTTEELQDEENGRGQTEPAIPGPPDKRNLHRARDLSMLGGESVVRQCIELVCQNGNVRSVTANPSVLPKRGLSTTVREDAGR
jgi:hypothetical protein